MKTKTCIRWALAALVLVLLLCAGGLYELFDGTFWPITSTWRYRSVLADIRADNSRLSVDADVLKYFPPSIPASASNCRLNYQTPPGDVDLELRYTAPKAEVVALIKRISPIAIVSANGSDAFMAATSGYNGLFTPAFYVGDTPGAWSLPETYTIYLMGTGRSKPLDNTAVRYMFGYGVAINPMMCDVIYWMDGSATGVQPSSAPSTNP